MKVLRKMMMIGAVVPVMAGQAWALDAYPSDVATGFTSWCTGQSYSATVCSCAASKAAVEIPAVAMATFLAAPEGSGTASMTSGVGASALQIVTTCAVGSASGATNSVQSIGSSLFGK